MSLAELFYAKHPRRPFLSRFRSRRGKAFSNQPSAVSASRFQLEPLEPRLLLSAMPTEVAIDQALEPAAVTAQNVPLTATPQSVTTDEETATSFVLKGSGGTGNPLAFAIATLPAHGTLTGPTVSFNTAVIPVGANPQDVLLGDLNNDGHLDMAVIDQNANTLSILLNDTTGGFLAPTTMATGTAPVDLLPQDFNRDGNLDLMVTGSTGVSIHLGTGTGAFAAAPLVVAGLNPVYTDFNDFNRDGQEDLAVVNSGDNSVSIKLGVGDGTFTNGQTLAAGTSPTYAISKDFNGDGKGDLAVTNASGSTAAVGSVALFLGNGDGTFGAPTFIDVGPNPLSLQNEDFNQDGKRDLVVMHGASASPNANSVAVLLNTTPSLPSATATFGAPTFYAVGVNPSGGKPDVNGDGVIDLAVVNAGSNNMMVLLGRGDGTFAAPVTVVTGLLSPVGGDGGDLNRDGRVDVVLANSSNGTVSILTNTTFYTYTPAANYSGPDSFTFTVNDGTTTSAPATVSISVTAQPEVFTVDIGDATVVEGNTGTTVLTFPVTLSAASTQTVTVDYSVVSNSAVAGTDFVAASGTVTFAPGVTVRTIDVTIIGDLVFESPGETFLVNLSGASGGTIGDSQGVGTIVDTLDTDLDGVPDDQEAGRGDGNGDAIPDFQQAHVASLETALNQFVTLVGPAGTVLTNVQTNTPPIGVPASVTFPAGFWSFSLQGVTPGGTATVQVLLPAGANPNTYWKFGPEPGTATPHAYQFLYDGTTGATVLGNMVALTFVDGGRGDADMITNGVITDPGGAGFLPVTLDVDGNGQADALSDGIAIVRYLFGFTGEALISGVVDPAGSRNTAASVENYLRLAGPAMLDVDSNGQADALSDGIAIVRYLFGFTGDALTSGVVDLSGKRSEAPAIETFLQGFLPGSTQTSAETVVATATSLSTMTVVSESAASATDLSFAYVQRSWVKDFVAGDQAAMEEDDELLIALPT